MFKFPDFINVPLDTWVDALMEWVLNTFAGFFESMGTSILWFMLIIEKFFLREV